MKKIFAILLIIFLNIQIACSSAVETNQYTKLQIKNKLDGQDLHTDLILTPKDKGLPKDEGETKHIFLKNNTKKVLIVAGDYDLKKEEESFAQFRRHYIIYWALLLTLGLTTQWSR